MGIYNYPEHLFVYGLRHIRKKKKLSQQGLANAAGVSLKMIKDYENGRHDINKAAADTVYKMSKALGCNMEQLINVEVIHVPVCHFPYDEHYWLEQDEKEKILEIARLQKQVEKLTQEKRELLHQIWDYNELKSENEKLKQYITEIKK